MIPIPLQQMGDLTPYSWREKIAILGHGMAQMEQVDCPLQHFFAPGVYVREIFMPAGLIVIGKIHRTEHLNIIESGEVELFGEDGSVETLTAPCTFVSQAGVQKVLRIVRDCRWKTVHVTDETDVPTLEVTLVEPIPPMPSLELMRRLEGLPA